MVGYADDISGVGFFDELAVSGQEDQRIVDSHGFSAAHVDHFHATLKFSRADTNKSYAVAVLGIHVGLNFENEGAHSFVGGFHQPRFSLAVSVVVGRIL